MSQRDLLNFTFFFDFSSSCTWARERARTQGIQQLVVNLISSVSFIWNGKNNIARHQHGKITLLLGTLFPEMQSWLDNGRQLQLLLYVCHIHQIQRVSRGYLNLEKWYCTWNSVWCWDDGRVAVHMGSYCWTSCNWTCSPPILQFQVRSYGVVHQRPASSVTPRWGLFPSI